MLLNSKNNNNQLNNNKNQQLQNNNMQLNNLNNQQIQNNNLWKINNNFNQISSPIKNNFMNNQNVFTPNINNVYNFNNQNMKMNSNPLMMPNNNFHNINPNFNNNFNNQFMFNNMMMNQFQLQTPPSNQLGQNNFQNMKKSKSSPYLSKKPYTITKISANGLQNIGATCYMNATLQCLAHVEPFTKHLLYNKSTIKNKKYQNKLANAFLEVIENLWENKSKTYYAPYNFKDLISKMNPLFAGIQANDSKDLVLFLLETMHNELNKVKNIVQFDDNIDQYNFEKSFMSFQKYFQNNFQSVVSDIFYGMYNSRMKCLKCNVITHNIQCFNILIIPLEEVRKFKNRPQNYVQIRECFEYYQKEEYMVGQNQIYCNACKQMADSINCTNLIVGPRVLVINLNRGKGLQFNIKLDFTEYINISDFIYYKTTYVNYRLIGVVTHFGPSGESGHFIAFCRSFVDNNWYKYNDAIVSSSNFIEVRDTGVPYILFYEAA